MGSFYSMDNVTHTTILEGEKVGVFISFKKKIFSNFEDIILPIVIFGTYEDYGNYEIIDDEKHLEYLEKQRKVLNEKFQMIIDDAEPEDIDFSKILNDTLNTNIRFVYRDEGFAAKGDQQIELITVKKGFLEMLKHNVSKIEYEYKTKREIQELKLLERFGSADLELLKIKLNLDEEYSIYTVLLKQFIDTQKNKNPITSYGSQNYNRSNLKLLIEFYQNELDIFKDTMDWNEEEYKEEFEYERKITLMKYKKEEE